MKIDRYIVLIALAGSFLSGCATTAISSGIENELPIYSKSTTDISVLGSLKALENDTSYQRALSEIYKEVSNCATWVVSRTTPSSSSARSITFLCSSNENGLLRVGYIENGKLTRRIKEQKKSLDGVTERIKKAKIVAESRYILTDSTVTFLTMKTDGEIYRRAIVCSNCHELDEGMSDDPDFKAMLSVVADIENFVER